MNLETVFPNGVALKTSRGARARMEKVRHLLPSGAMARVLPFKGGFLPVVYLPPDSVHVAAMVAMQGVSVTNFEALRHLFF